MNKRLSTLGEQTTFDNRTEPSVFLRSTISSWPSIYFPDQLFFAISLLHLFVSTVDSCIPTEFWSNQPDGTRRSAFLISASCFRLSLLSLALYQSWSSIRNNDSIFLATQKIPNFEILSRMFTSDIAPRWAPFCYERGLPRLAGDYG